MHFLDPRDTHHAFLMRCTEPTVNMSCWFTTKHHRVTSWGAEHGVQMAWCLKTKEGIFLHSSNEVKSAWLLGFVRLTIVSFLVVVYFSIFLFWRFESFPSALRQKQNKIEFSIEKPIEKKNPNDDNIRSTSTWLCSDSYDSGHDPVSVIVTWNQIGGWGGVTGGLQWLLEFDKGWTDGIFWWPTKKYIMGYLESIIIKYLSEKPHGI